MKLGYSHETTLRRKDTLQEGRERSEILECVKVVTYTNAEFGVQELIALYAVFIEVESRRGKTKIAHRGAQIDVSFVFHFAIPLFVVTTVSRRCSVQFKSPLRDSFSTKTKDFDAAVILCLQIALLQIAVVVVVIHFDFGWLKIILPKLDNPLVVDEVARGHHAGKFRSSVLLGMNSPFRGPQKSPTDLFAVTVVAAPHKLASNIVHHEDDSGWLQGTRWYAVPTIDAEATCRVTPGCSSMPPPRFVHPTEVAARPFQENRSQLGCGRAKALAPDRIECFGAREVAQVLARGLERQQRVDGAVRRDTKPDISWEPRRSGLQRLLRIASAVARLSSPDPSRACVRTRAHAVQVAVLGASWR